METAAEIREKLKEEWIPAIYREKVRSQRTRAYHLNITPTEHRT